MKSHVLHTVWCYFWWGCRGNLTLITLGSERLTMFKEFNTYYRYFQVFWMNFSPTSFVNKKSAVCVRKYMYTSSPFQLSRYCTKWRIQGSFDSFYSRSSNVEPENSILSLDTYWYVDSKHLLQHKIVHKENGTCTRGEILSRLPPSCVTMAANADQRKLRQIRAIRKFTSQPNQCASPGLLTCVKLWSDGHPSCFPETSVPTTRRVLVAPAAFSFRSRDLFSDLRLNFVGKSIFLRSLKTGRRTSDGDYSMGRLCFDILKIRWM